PPGAGGATGPQGPPGSEGPMGPPGMPGAALVGVQNVIPDEVWAPGLAWTTVMSGVAGTTAGRPLLIQVTIPVTATNPGLIACQPTIDGAWAGAFAMTPPSGAADFSKEGTLSAIAPWGATTTSMIWRSSRVYASIPAGLHQFSVQ